MQFLLFLRRKHPGQCLPELRRRFLFPAYPAEQQLENRLNSTLLWFRRTKMPARFFDALPQKPEAISEGETA